MGCSRETPEEQVGSAQRRAPQLRDGGTRAGHGRAAPKAPPPACGFVSPQARVCCGYGCAFTRARTPRIPPGEGEQPPDGPSGDPRARLPEAATAPGGGGPAGRRKGGKGRRAPSEPRGLPSPDSAQSPAPPRLLLCDFPSPSSHSPV